MALHLNVTELLPTLDELKIRALKLLFDQSADIIECFYRDPHSWTTEIELESELLEQAVSPLALHLNNERMIQRIARGAKTRPPYACRTCCKS